MASKLIVGLGNPGPEHSITRHNVGFLCADYIAKKLHLNYKYDKKKSVYGKKRFPPHEVIILKPQTFSNLSGEAVLYIASFLKVDIENVFVIFDDVTLRLGEAQIQTDLLKIEHNAIFHLCNCLRNDKFIKCGFGIGPIPKHVSLEDYYLENFSEPEEKQLEAVYQKVFELAVMHLQIPLEAAK